MREIASVFSGAGRRLLLLTGSAATRFPVCFASPAATSRAVDALRRFRQLALSGRGGTSFFVTKRLQLDPRAALPPSSLARSPAASE